MIKMTNNLPPASQDGASGVVYHTVKHPKWDLWFILHRDGLEVEQPEFLSREEAVAYCDYLNLRG